ncbi:hypothetical protein LINPERHAP1_LOCUS31450, partial [Linum perenne]
ENPTHYVVPYDKLFEEKSGKIPLQKTLHLVQLRPWPAPPPIKTNKSLQVQGQRRSRGVPLRWLVGSITEELAAGKFVIFFQSSKEQIVFGE